MGEVQARKLILVRLLLKSDVVDDPVIERAVIFKFYRAERVGYPLERVLNGVREIVERIDAPFVSLTVVRRVYDAVDGRVAQIHVRGGHVYLCAQSVAAVRKFAVLHALEQLEVLLDGAVAVGAVLARLGQSSAVFAHLVGAEIADVSLTLADELYGEFVAFVKIVGAVIDPAVRLGAEPAQILLDGADVFVVLAHRVGVVVAQVEFAAVFERGALVDPYRLRAADVEIAVRLRRKTGVDLRRGYTSPGDVAVDNIVYKVAGADFFHIICLPFR